MYSLCVLILSLSIIVLRFTHVDGRIGSFLLLSSISIYGCATFCLCISQLTDIWVVSSLGLL